MPVQPELIKAEGDNQFIFELEMDPIVKKEAPREPSLFGLQDGSINDFGEEYQEFQDDLFFGAEADQQPRLMGADRSEKNNENASVVQDDNVEFEQANLLNYQAQLPLDYDSSDSSMITDE